MATRLLFDLTGEVDDRGRCSVGGGAGQWQPAVTVEQGVIYAALSEGHGHWFVEVVRAQGGRGTLIASGDGDCIASSFILNPGELIQATVIHAPPRSRVTGSVNGTQAWNPDELPPLYGASACGGGGLELPHDIDINLNLREPLRVIVEGNNMPCSRCGQEPCCCPGFPITSPTAPPNPNFGQLWLDNSAGDPPLAKVWNGRVWETIRANTTLVQEFRTAGQYTYTLPAGAQNVMVLLLGPGGGGGSGDRRASGTASQGGTGGSGGAWEQHFLSAANILQWYPNGQVPVWVGPGGIGGASQGTDNSPGNPGVFSPYTTQFGRIQIGTAVQSGAFALVTAGLGGGTPIGQAVSANIGVGSQQLATGTAPGSPAAVPIQQAQGPFGNGGGGGGSITTAPALLVPINGAVRAGVGAGSQTYVWASPQTAAVVIVPGGVASVDPNYAGSSGSGGAASLTGAATAGNPGGPGSGGGGGGASLNGFASGAGGNGGDGYVVIETSF